MRILFCVLLHICATALSLTLLHHIGSDSCCDLCDHIQGCISCGPCSCPELTEDHVLPSAYVEIFRTVTRNAVNKSV